MKNLSAGFWIACALHASMFLALAGESQANKPIADCPVNLLAMVKICDAQGKNCVWRNYCAYLGFGVNVDDDSAFDPGMIAPVPCVDLCNQNHDSLQERQACYERCGVPPADFVDQLRIPPPAPRPGPSCPSWDGVSHETDPGPGGAGPECFSISFYAGVVQESGGNQDDEVGLGLAAGLEVPLTDFFSFDLILGHDAINRESLSADGGAADLDVTHLSFLGKLFRRVSKRVRIFGRAGVGLYDLDPGSTESGLSGGLGFGYGLTSDALLEFSGTYHAVAGDADVDFVNLQVGLRWRF